MLASRLGSSKVPRMAGSAGLAWAPKANEVLVAGERPGRGRDIIAVSMTGKERTVLTVPSRATLYDTNAKGEVLLSFDSSRREIVAGTRSGVNSFAANGSLTLGSALWNARAGDRWPGQIDQVQLWQGVLSDRQIVALYKNS